MCQVCLAIIRKKRKKGEKCREVHRFGHLFGEGEQSQAQVRSESALKAVQKLDIGSKEKVSPVVEY